MFVDNINTGIHTLFYPNQTCTYKQTIKLLQPLHRQRYPANAIHILTDRDGRYSLMTVMTTVTKWLLKASHDHSPVRKSYDMISKRIKINKP